MAEAGEPDVASVSLAKLVRTHARLQLSADALRRLYKDFLSAGLLDPAVDTLRLLRRVDPLRHDRRRRPLGARLAGVPGGQTTPRRCGSWSDARRALSGGRRRPARPLLAGPRPGGARARASEAHAIYRELVAASDTTDFYPGRR